MPASDCHNFAEKNATLLIAVLDGLIYRSISRSQQTTTYNLVLDNSQNTLFVDPGSNANFINFIIFLQ